MLQDIDLKYVNGVLTTSAGLSVGGTLTVSGSSVSAPNEILPGDHGLIAWSYDPSFASTGQLAANGTMYLSRVAIRQATTVNKLWWLQSTAGASAVAGQNWAALINSAGTVLGSVGIDSFVTQSNSAQTATLGASVSVAAGLYWVALLWNATTPPTMIRTNGSFTGTNNAGLTGASLRYATNGTGQTAMPASITPSSNAVGASIWAAVS